MDEDSFHLGVGFRHQGRERCSCWATIHIDGISELFGEHIMKVAKKLSMGDRVEIVLSADIL